MNDFMIGMHKIRAEHTHIRIIYNFLSQTDITIKIGYLKPPTFHILQGSITSTQHEYGIPKIINTTKTFKSYGIINLLMHPKKNIFYINIINGSCDTDNVVNCR